MPSVLTRLTIKEVAGVDKGAGKGVRVLLMKNDKDAGHFDIDAIDSASFIKHLNDNKPLIKGAFQKSLGAYNAEWDKYEKRDFNTARRKELAASGHAMPDGSFPIENEEDLHNAVRLAGHAKDPAAAKKHIMARASSMGMSGSLPDTWTKTKKSQSFLVKLLAKIGVRKDDVVDVTHMASADGGMISDAEDQMIQIHDAICALEQSICSIICAEEAMEKKAALEETVSQFVKHVQGTVPEVLVDAMAAAAGLILEGQTMMNGGDINKGVETMTEKELNEAIAKAVKAATDPLQVTIKSLTSQVNVLKMSDAHQNYMNHPDAKMPDGGKEAFEAMSPEDRAAHVDKHPINKAKTDIEKRLDTSEATVAQLRVDIAKRDDDILLSDITKRVTEWGASPDVAGSIFALEKAGKKTEAAALEKHLKATAAQLKTANLFKEFGSSQGSDATSATARFDMIVADIRKANPKLSKDQAIAKIAGMPEHTELWKAYREELGNGKKAA